MGILTHFRHRLRSPFAYGECWGFCARNTHWFVCWEREDPIFINTPSWKSCKCARKSEVLTLNSYRSNEWFAWKQKRSWGGKNGKDGSCQENSELLTGAKQRRIFLPKSTSSTKNCLLGNNPNSVLLTQLTPSTRQRWFCKPWMLQAIVNSFFLILLGRMELYPVALWGIDIDSG